MSGRTTRGAAASLDHKEALLQKWEQFTEDILRARREVPEPTIPDGASHDEIQAILIAHSDLADEAAEPFVQAIYKWQTSLKRQDRLALGLESTPEKVAYIEEHVADVFGA